MNRLEHRAHSPLQESLDRWNGLELPYDPAHRTSSSSLAGFFVAICVGVIAAGNFIRGLIRFHHIFCFINDIFIDSIFVDSIFVRRKRGPLTRFRKSVVDADKLEDRLMSGVAQPSLGNTENTRVSAGSVCKAGRDIVKQDANSRFVAQQLQRFSASSQNGCNRLIPLLPLLAFSPRLPIVATAFSVAFEASGFIRILQRTPGDRDALFDEATDFLCLFNGCDNASFHFRRVVIVFCISLCEEQAAGKVSPHSQSMAA